jgi:hypothetical protein
VIIDNVNFHIKVKMAISWMSLNTSLVTSKLCNPINHADPCRTLLREKWLGIINILGCGRVLQPQFLLQHVDHEPMLFRPSFGAGQAISIRLTNNCPEIIQRLRTTYAAFLPVTMLLMDSWLSQFAYHVPQQVMDFLATSLIMITLAISTVAMPVMRSARINLLKTLKHE